MNLYPFIITTIAGLSTLIGYFVIFIKKTDKIIVSSLAFASSVMLFISIFDLLPESINLLNNINLFPLIIIILISINIGIILSISINKYLPNNNELLYRVGVISMLVIIIHNIPEGIATYIASNTNYKLGIRLAIAITLHNIPEGISIAVPIYYSTRSKIKTFIYTFISGLSEIFGALIASIFLTSYINNYILGITFMIIAGLMVHISLKELLPMSLSYNNKKYTYIYYLIGVILVIISKIVIG